MSRNLDLYLEGILNSIVKIFFAQLQLPYC